MCALFLLSQVLEFSASVIFSLHMLWRIFSFYQSDTKAGRCVCTNVKVCAKMFPWSCRWMRHTIPGISLKKTGRTFTVWISVASWIQRIISTQAAERFRCHEDISGWIFLTLLGFYFLSSFLGSSNNRKKKIEKKKATVWRYLSVCGTDFCFHFTVFYIIKNNSKTWSALCVSLNLQEKFSFVYRFYLYTICDSISQSKTSFWCN